ncbi:MAG: hypothetical protein Q4C83_01375 [Candidatus Saccharibacteria bacterium]|nr:hypothetical protein [Candidatus Saccharibacteria bacterium]
MKLICRYASCLLVTVAVVTLGGAVARAVEVDETLDHGLGISVNQTELELYDDKVQPDIKSRQHKIKVSTPYYMGYKLWVAAATSDMVGDKGSTIPAMMGRDDKLELPDNSWGFSTELQNGGRRNWHGFVAGQNYLVGQHEPNYFPASDREHKIRYGVNPGKLTIADTYRVQVTYTVTPELPENPVIISAPKYHRIRDDSTAITLSGYNLDDVTDIGLDFDGNMSITEFGRCQIVSQAYEKLVCNIPDSPPNGLTHATPRLLIKTAVDTDNANARDTGHRIEYYYQPRIESVYPNELTVKANSLAVMDAIGGDTPLILTNDSDIYQWGNIKWQLGDYTGGSVVAPAIIVKGDVSDSDPIVGLMANHNSYVALARSGRMYYWGSNSTGRSGWVQTSTPVADDWSKSRAVKAASLGQDFGVALTDNGIFTWGNNARAQLGCDKGINEVPRSAEPVQAKGESYKLLNGETYMSVSAGNHHVVAMTNYGRVVTWGAHGDDQLGFSTNSDAVHPHDITGTKSGDYLRNYRDKERIIKALAGADFSVALTNTGKVLTWGNNSVGQLGIGSAITVRKQANVINITDVIADINVRDRTVLALSKTGQVYGWGDGLGVSPTLLTLPSGCVANQIAAGSTSYVRCSDGRLVAYTINSGLASMSDVTTQLTHPVSFMRLTGRNLDKLGSGQVWVDYRADGRFDAGDDERLLRYYLEAGSSTNAYAQVAVPSWINSSGKYDVLAKSDYGGVGFLGGAVTVNLIDKAKVVTSNDVAGNWTNRRPDVSQALTDQIIVGEMVEPTEENEVVVDLDTTADIEPDETDLVTETELVETIDPSENVDSAATTEAETTTDAVESDDENVLTEDDPNEQVKDDDSRDCLEQVEPILASDSPPV